MQNAPAAQSLIESAAQAASSGDLVSAESLLRQAARMQEGDLGPLHPDLASTFNNLGVLCEKANKLADAEQFYRRASTIAAAALDSVHPLAVTSRENLVEFCRAHGRPLEEPATAAAELTLAAGSTLAAEPTPAARPAPTFSALAASVAPTAAVKPPVAAPTPSVPSNGRSRALVGAAIVSVASLVALLAVWSARTEPGKATTDEHAEAALEEPVSAAPSVPPTGARMASPAAESRVPGEATVGNVAPAAPSERVLEPPASPVIDAPAGQAGTAGALNVRVVEAAVCRNLSTARSPWQCSTPSDPVQPGPLFFYTRIAAPRSMRVHHRWYRGDRLLQEVELAIAANPGSGYRTYSRQTVDASNGGDWRVELVTAEGALLREVRISVH